MVDFMDNKGCKYPEGDAHPYSYCGDLRQKDSSYCYHHHRLCHSASTPTMRGAANDDEAQDVLCDEVKLEYGVVWSDQEI